MRLMLRRVLVAAVVVVVLVVAAWWSLLVWVPADGAVWVWDSGAGILSVPGHGLKVLPRWAGERLAPGELAVEIVGRSQDDVRVSVTLALTPPVGEWRLAPAASPVGGLRALATAPVGRRLEAGPAACFVGGRAAAAAECPVGDPTAELQGWLATTVRLPSAAVTATITPDPDALRLAAVAEIRDRLAPTRRKVLLLGLDGMDWRLVLPWVQAGQMPNLARLMKAGTWGEMDTMVPMLSPLIWTTMATGVGPEVHGVLDFVEKDPSTGQPVPITGRGRKVPAIWNIASELGLEADVVGWWATWPAELVSGTMVSDRLYYTLQQGIPKESFEGDPEHLVYPPERTAEFTALRDRAVSETDWRAVRYFMNIPESVFDRAVAADEGMDDPVDGLRRIVSATRTYLGAGLKLAEEQPDMLLVYLEGTDTIGHLLATYMPPPTIEVDPAAAAVYAAAVPKYFQVVDRWIGRYLELCPLSKYTVIVVSDHGFTWQDDRPKGLSGTAGPTAPLWHAPNAVFVIAGPGVAARGRVATRASVFDITPTLAALLGIPPDPAWRTSLLPGTPPAESLSQVSWGPLVPSSSYRENVAGSAPANDELMAQLRALGYIGDDGTSAGAVTPPATAAGATTTTAAPPPTATPQPATTTRAQLNNLALLKINQKDYAEGEKLLRQAIAMSPEYAAPHFNLRRVYMETEQYDQADEQLWIAVDKGLRDPVRTLDRAAADYDSLSLPERADALLTRAINSFPDHEPFYVHLMVVKLRRDRCGEAIPIGAEAVQRFPDSGPVHAFYGLAAACDGLADLARREIERSLEINPDQPQLRQALSQLDAQQSR